MQLVRVLQCFHLVGAGFAIYSIYEWHASKVEHVPIGTFGQGLSDCHRRSQTTTIGTCEDLVNAQYDTNVQQVIRAPLIIDRRYRKIDGHHRLVAHFILTSLLIRTLPNVQLYVYLDD